MPAAVVDLAERREHVRSLLSVHGEDGAEVLQDEDPARADLAEEPAARPGRGVLSRRAAQERGFCERAGEVDAFEPGRRVEGFRLAASGRADENEPGRVEVLDPVCRDSRAGHVDGGRIREVEPTAKRL